MEMKPEMHRNEWCTAILMHEMCHFIAVNGHRKLLHYIAQARVLC